MLHYYHDMDPMPPHPLLLKKLQWERSTSAIESIIHRGADKHKASAAIVNSARFIPRYFYKAAQNQHIKLHGN